MLLSISKSIPFETKGTAEKCKGKKDKSFHIRKNQCLKNRTEPTSSISWIRNWPICLLVWFRLHCSFVKSRLVYVVFISLLLLLCKKFCFIFYLLICHLTQFWLNQLNQLNDNSEVSFVQSTVGFFKYWHKQ